MTALRTPDDLIQSYARMRRTVLGLLDQSLPTVRRPAYGNGERVLLKAGRGWETNIGEAIFKPKLVAIVLADHTVIQGAVKWVSGKDNRAVVLPLALTPPDNCEFFTRRDDGSEVVLRVTSDGYIRMPAGNTSIVNLFVKYPTPLDGG